MKTRFTQLFVALALTVALTPVAFADPPAGKGNDKGMEQHGQSGEHGKGDQGSYPDYGKDSNHGQVVSECNHRANERNLKGQDRKNWVEWCEEHGNHYKYDYNHYNTGRNCYQKADNKGLSGDKRRKFINNCLDQQVYAKDGHRN